MDKRRNRRLGHFWDKLTETFNFFKKLLPFLSDRVVMIGNHRDAWVYGGLDPSSGTAVLMEVGRILGHMLKDGLLITKYFDQHA